jgi:hypothetical protein
MKIKICLAFIAFNLGLYESAFSQTFLGVKFGLVRSNLNLNRDDFRGDIPKYKSGIAASLGLRTYLSKKLSLEFDAQYAAMGSNVQVGSRKEDILRLNFNYLSIPVSLYFDVLQREKISLNLHSGIAPGILISGEIIDDVETEKLGPAEDIFSFDVFWQSGIGFQYMPAEKLAFRADLNNLKGLLDVNLDGDSEQMKNKAFALCLGIALKL